MQIVMIHKVIRSEAKDLFVRIIDADVAKDPYSAANTTVPTEFA
jgi:hypothetical protein